MPSEPSQSSLFSIKPGYYHSATAEPFDDTANTDEWQREVYELAEKAMVQNHWSKVIDVGCGSGFKLVHQLGRFQTVGIEIEPTFTFLKKRYPDRQWQEFTRVNTESLRSDLVICSDVVEHLPNPDEIMSFLLRLNAKQVIISTPERDSIEGKGDFGPPANPAHFREWNMQEFSNYVSSWFRIKAHYIFPGQSVTQVVICEKK